MIGRAGLTPYFSRVTAAPGSSRHLGEQLERPLGGAKVGKVERDVGVEHADQRDSREIESLGHHLGSEQDVGLAARERGQDGLGPLALPRHIGVEAQHAGFGERACQLAFGALRSRAGETEELAPAARALTARRFLVIAIVAAPGAGLEVERERDVAVRTGGNEAADATLGVVGVTAAVEEQDRLLAS